MIEGLPHEVNVGGFVYKVEEARGLIPTEGEHRRTSGRLLLDSDICAHPDRMREVLVHEILHAIRNNGGYNENIGSDEETKAGRDEAERWICSIQWGIVQVLRDNPTLVAYLTSRG